MQAERDRADTALRDQAENTINQLRARRRLLGFGLILTIFFILISALLLPKITSASVVEVMDVIASVGLSAALLYVYLEQNQLLEIQSMLTTEQTEISATQSEIMRGDYIPILTTHENGASLYDGQPSLNRDGDELTVKTSDDSDGVEDWFGVVVSNLGNEIAENIRVYCLLHYNEAEADGLDASYDGRVCELQTDGTFTTTRGVTGTVLSPEMDERLLYGNPLLERKRDGKTTSYTYMEGVRDILQAGAPVKLGFVLQFENTHGRTFSLPLDSTYYLRPDRIDDIGGLMLSDLDIDDYGYDLDKLLEECGMAEQSDDGRPPGH